MKTKISLVLLVFIFPLAAFGEGFSLSSQDIAPGSTIAQKFVYNGFGCSGENVSPALVWKNAPEGTKSFAVTMYDPDAPTGSGWWHWLVVNIPPGQTGIPSGGGKVGDPSLPAAVLQTRTDFGSVGYGGPCPPVGDKPHRYIFTVFALGVERLEVDSQSSGALVGYMINHNTLAKAQFSAFFGR